MLGRLFQRPVEQRAAPFVVHAAGGLWGWTAGVDVDALRNGAVWACSDVLCGEVSKLPVDVVRTQQGARLPVSPAPSLIAAPSATVTLDVWLYGVVWSMIHDGNAFGRVVEVDRSGWPTQIELVDPNAVGERTVERGVKRARIDGAWVDVYPHGDLWHVPGKMVPAGGAFGLSPVKYAEQAIKAGMEAEAFGRNFFGAGGLPSGIVYADSDIGPENAELVKRKVMNAAHEPAVLGAGLRFEKVSVTPNESQFIDLQRFTIEQVCRFLGVPPSMVYGAISGQNVTYANVSQADLHFLKHSLDGYLIRIEHALSALLPIPQVVRFNRNALLRADAEGRNKVYDTRLKNRTLSVNEVRALEDEPPFDDPAFDEPGIPGDDDERRRLSAVEAIQKVYLGIGKVITSDEARELVNGAGADLPIPGPQFTV